MLLRAPVYTADKGWKNLKLGVPIHILRKASVTNRNSPRRHRDHGEKTPGRRPSESSRYYLTRTFRNGSLRDLCTTIRQFLRGPRRFSWHGLPARESVTARMAVPHFGCGSAALCLRGGSFSHDSIVILALMGLVPALRVCRGQFHFGRSCEMPEGSGLKGGREHPAVLVEEIADDDNVVRVAEQQAAKDIGRSHFRFNLCRLAVGFLRRFLSPDCQSAMDWRTIMEVEFGSPLRAMAHSASEPS